MTVVSMTGSVAEAARYAGRTVDMLGDAAADLTGPGGRPLRIGLFGTGSAPLEHSGASVGRRRIAAAIERMGGEVFSFNAQGTTVDRNGRVVLARSLEHGGAVLQPFPGDIDAVLVRGGSSIPGPALDALHEIRGARGIPVMSTADAIRAAQSKAVTAELLDAAGVPTPRTALISPATSRNDAKRAISELADLDTQGRVVIKIPQGTQGKGVVIADSPGQAMQVVELLQDARSGAEVLLAANGMRARRYQGIVASGVDAARRGQVELRRYPPAELRASVDEAIDQVGLPLRLQVRGPEGLSRAVLVDSASAARQVAEAHWANEKLAVRIGTSEPTLARMDDRLLVQEFIPEAGGNDTRAFTMRAADGNYDVVASMERVAAAGESRANLHQGGSAVAQILDDEARSIAARSAGALDLHIGGVDLLKSSRGLLVVEINSSPGFGIAQATGVDVPELVGRMAMREAWHAANAR